MTQDAAPQPVPQQPLPLVPGRWRLDVQVKEAVQHLSQSNHLEWTNLWHGDHVIEQNDQGFSTREYAENCKQQMVSDTANPPMALNKWNWWSSVPASTEKTNYLSDLQRDVIPSPEIHVGLCWSVVACQSREIKRLLLNNKQKKAAAIDIVTCSTKLHTTR